MPDLLHHRNIAHKRFVMPSIRRGSLMRLFLDTETYGFNRTGVPYATPAYPAISEYGDALLDISYNYLNSAQIFPRRPKWLVPQPSAVILQRLNGLEDLDDPARPKYWVAMANIAWRIEQAKYAYDQLFPDEATTVSVTYHFKGNKKDVVENVIPVPLLDNKGEVCYDVRYHPDQKFLSYRVDQKPYRKYYRDKADGSFWICVELSLNIHIFNGRYDLPVIRTNLYRVGFDPEDTTFLYARGTPSSKQQSRNYVIDVMDEIYTAAIYGSQTEDGIKLGRLIDPVTRRIRTSESQSAFFNTNTRQPNMMRFVRGGPFMPHDNSKHDKNFDHGAAYDALGAAAASALVALREPEISGMVAEQAADDERKGVLKAKSPNGSYLPVHSLPYRQGGYHHSELPYIYLGSDSQHGDFKQHIFLLGDGSLHTRTFLGKPLHELSAEEWKKFLSSDESRNVVRFENLRYMPTAIHIDKVMQQTSAVRTYRGNLANIKLDCAYVLKYKDSFERLNQAIADANHARRFDRPIPQVPLIEDELPSQYAGIAYQEELEEIKKRRREIGGAREVDPLEKTIKESQQNAYGFMRAIDRAGRRMCLRAHIIDGYYGHDLDDKIHETDDHARAALISFTDICNSQYRDVYARKDCPYTSVLDSILKPNGAPYFVKGKFNAATVGEALHFRTLLALRMMKDYNWLLKREGSDYIDGFVDKDFCRQTGPNGRELFLFADPDNGEKGAPPHIIDEYKRELPLPYIMSLPKNDVMKKLIDASEWRHRLYRLRSEPTHLRMAYRFTNLELDKDLPPSVRRLYKGDLLAPYAQDLYKADDYRRKRNFPNETVATARAPTLLTSLHEVKRLKAAATARNPETLERATEPHLAEAARVIKKDEGLPVLERLEKSYRKELRAYPEQSDLCMTGGYDTKSGLPFDNIPYTLKRDAKKSLARDKNFVMLDVPLWHAHHLPKQSDISLPHCGLVVHGIYKNTRDAINRRGRKVVIHVPETGQIYHTGIASVHPLPPHSHARYDEIVKKAQSDYKNAGQEITGRKINYLGVENLYAVANTRQKIDYSVQSIKLPHVQFYGLVAPQFVSLGDKPITAVVIPADYLPQKLTRDAPIRLCEMNAQSFANMKGEQGVETGHTYQSILREVYGNRRELTIEKLLSSLTGSNPDPNLRSATRRAGFTGPDHLRRELDRWTAEAWKSDPNQQPIKIILFDKVKCSSWAMCHMNDAPLAAFSYDGNPVPPSAYRPPAGKFKANIL